MKERLDRQILIFTCCLIFLFFTSEAGGQKIEDKGLPTLSYVELMENAELYLGRPVRVRAFHVYGFEWSFLCDGNCKNGKWGTWVEFVREDDLCKGSKEKLKKGRDNFNNKAEVVYVGKLARGHFGHFGVYEYQFTVSCVEKFRKIKI